MMEFLKWLARYGILFAVFLVIDMIWLVTYATYDLTNLATVRGWPLLVTVVDLAWGTGVSLAVSVFGFLLIRRFVP